MTLLGIRPTFWPTVFTLPALLILITLGSWQVQRLNWKEAMIAERVERAKGPTSPFPTDQVDPAEWDFRAASVTGTFHHDQEKFLMARTLRGNVGYHVITPLERADGSFVLVNRGWVPLDHQDASLRTEGQVSGSVTIEGVARKSQIQHWLTPDNEPDRNRWFFMDVKAMARDAGIDVPNALYLEAGPAENPGNLPIGGQAKINLPNNHLQYAITWFSLAFSLAVIYVLYHRSRAKEA